MYIKAIIKNRQDEIIPVTVRNEASNQLPKGFFQQIKYAVATNDLLLKFYRAFHKYANDNYILIEIHTDNALLADKLLKERFPVVFDPYPEEEMIQNE